MNTRNNVGPSTVPWGTPDVTWEHMEAFVSQIMDHLDNQHILNENQHGFRAKRSCESQLLMTTNDITKWMNNNIQVDIAILDYP
jgi:hypothetical protein